MRPPLGRRCTYRPEIWRSAAMGRPEDEIPFDPEELTSIVRERDLAENNIHWLSRSPFNDTYGFASSPDVTAANGGAFDMQSMADYLAANPDATLCLECPARADLVTVDEAFEIERDLAGGASRVLLLRPRTR